MNKFYKSTKYFWIVSRMLLILLFGSVILTRLFETELAGLIVNTLLVLVILSMLVIVVFGFLKKQPHHLLRFFVGTFTVLFGFLISYLLLTFGKTDYGIFFQIAIQVIPIWLILYGVFEITQGINSLKSNRG